MVSLRALGLHTRQAKVSCFPTRRFIPRRWLRERTPCPLPMRTSVTCSCWPALARPVTTCQNQAQGGMHCILTTIEAFKRRNGQRMGRCWSLCWSWNPRGQESGRRSGHERPRRATGLVVNATNSPPVTRWPELKFVY